MNSLFRTTLRWTLPVPVLAALIAAPVEAQREPRDFRSGIRTGAGYSGVMPNAILGLGVFHFMGARPAGVFADFHTTSISGIRKDATYCPAGIAECTNAWVIAHRNDQNVGSSEEWVAVNAGFMYALTPEFAVMVGAGVARETRFQEYVDDTLDEGRLTDSGHYFVDDDTTPGWKPQGVVGMLIRGGRNVAFRLGWESGVGGFGLGAYLRVR